MLEELKKYLNISWDDALIDDKLSAMMEDAKEALCTLTGTALDFSKGVPRELLFNRVRYAYNNALEFFETNFSKEITRLQLTEGVKKLNG